MLITDEQKKRVKELLKQVKGIGGSLNIPSLTQELELLKKQQENPDFWKDTAKAGVVGKKVKEIENKISSYDKLLDGLSGMEELLNMVEDEETLAELDVEIEQLATKTDALLVQTLLSGQYDDNDCIITLHAGAGGTEAQDWVSMLYRMYQMYCEKNGFTVAELDILDGEDAGIKSVTFEVRGDYAYGYLKAEKGVHRLVRISPFDSNSRRHTSFASCEVMPNLPDDGEVVIDEKELRIDTYRSSGAGGQHVNKTDSAIRITHLPSGIVVSCQNERSQIQNREKAMQMLKSKLIELKEREKELSNATIKGEIKKIEWGSQIRSYVFMPYTLVKDHRTGYENANVSAVMDGDIQPFIEDYLKKAY